MLRSVSQTVMDNLEMVAAGFGLANIILIVRRSIWNYPFALVMVTLYAIIFWEKKLYSDAGLQVFFFALNIYGWWCWGRNKADTGQISVRRMKPLFFGAWMAFTLVAIMAWGQVMHELTDASYPWWDASVAMLSVSGQILMTRRYIENWYYWIVVNILSIGLYHANGLSLTMILYGVFLMMAIWGLVTWRKAEARA